jgi:hypothetical protein
MQARSLLVIGLVSYVERSVHDEKAMLEGTCVVTALVVERWGH